MSATATLRNPAANNAQPNLFVRLLNSAKETLAALVNAISELVTPATANESDLRKLYRLSHGGDSVTPQVLEALRKTQVAAQRGGEGREPALRLTLPLREIARLLQAQHAVTSRRP